MTDEDHIMDETCPCLPTVTIDGLVIHNSFDGREFDEIAAEIEALEE